ncbi:hypothetical protein BGZ65_008454, partial [Modicella reniformis]
SYYVSYEERQHNGVGLNEICNVNTLAMTDGGLENLLKLSRLVEFQIDPKSHPRTDCDESIRNLRSLNPMTGETIRTESRNEFIKGL